MTVGKVCNRKVVYIEKHESIKEAALLMREHNVGDVIVSGKKMVR